jgi:hypothetical protein
MGPKELENYYGILRKKGEASFKVIFKAGPGDDSFSDDDPVAIVAITAKDPTTGKIFTKCSQMSTKACEFPAEIQVLSVVGVVKGFWDRVTGKEKPKPYQVTITVEPHSDWKENYSRNEFPLEVQAGPNPPQHVWMGRTKKSRFVLDKPKQP